MTLFLKSYQTVNQGLSALIKSLPAILLPAIGDRREAQPIHDLACIRMIEISLLPTGIFLLLSGARQRYTLAGVHYG
jgi:hypothetical protein